MAMKDSGIQWIGEIPENWNYIRLKDYFDFEKGKKAALYTQEYVGMNQGVYPVYSGQTENNGIMGLINSFDYNIRECLFTTTVGAKAMTAKILHGKFSLSQNCLIMNPIKNCCCNFFYYMLLPLFEYEKSRIPSYMQPSLRVEDLNTYGFFIPSNEEQKLIADFLDNKVGKIDDILTDLNNQVAILQKYKKSLITETVTKGLNPDVKMKDSRIEWIGEIPENWSINKLGYLGTLQNGISKGSEYFGSGFPFVSYGDVYNNILLPEEVEGLVESTKSEQSTYSVKAGDAFFTRTSETIEEIGFSSVCNKTIENSTFAGFLIRFRPTTELLNMSYAKYYFRAETLRAYFVKEMMIVTRASLGQLLLKKLPILLPSLKEQQEIADFLDKKCAQIDELIKDKKAQIDKMERYKKSLIYEYVTGKKRVKGAEI